MDYLISYDLNGKHVTERAEPDQLGRITKVAKGRGAKNIVTVLNKGSKIDKLVALAQAGDINAQEQVREYYRGAVTKTKNSGVFDQKGATFVKKGEAVTLGVSDWQPREIDDDLGVDDDPASNPDDLSNVKGDYEGGPDPTDIDEALVEWLSGKPAKARSIGLNESDIEVLLHSRTAIPVKMEFGQSLQSASLGNAQTAQGMDEAIEEVQPKGGIGNKSAQLRTPQKLWRPSSFK